MKFAVWIFSIFAVLAIFIFACNSYLSPDDLKNCSAPGTSLNQKYCDKNSVDAIVAVSGGNTSARTKEAVALYQKNWSKKIIFAGAAVDKSGPSNAKSMEAEAIKMGVASRDIIIDEKSQNTTENAEFVSEIIKKNKIKSIILTTSGYHQRRTFLEFSKKLSDSEIKIFNNPAKNDSDWGNFWWLNFRGWKLSLSEIGGIIIFYTNLGGK